MCFPDDDPALADRGADLYRQAMESLQDQWALFGAQEARAVVVALRGYRAIRDRYHDRSSNECSDLPRNGRWCLPTIETEFGPLHLVLSRYLPEGRIYARAGTRDEIIDFIDRVLTSNMEGSIADNTDDV